MSKIRRAVSLYSLQHEYATGEMTLEDLLAFLKDLGVEGFEFISDQMMHGTPYPSRETLKRWDELMSKYGVRPVCNDIFMDAKIYKNGLLTKKELLKKLIDEIKLADRLGFKLVRLVSNTPPEIIEPALPYAEQYDVVLAQEVHAGISFDHPATKRFVEIMKELDSPYLGLVIDLGIFCRKLPRVFANYFLTLGINPELVPYVEDFFARGTDAHRVFAEYLSRGDFPEEAKKLIRNEIDKEFLILSTGYENSDLSILDEYLPYIKHIHGKFYEMTEEDEEYSIPYGEIIDYLDKHNYNGYIASEYEGQRFTPLDQPVRSLEQVKKHQAMLKRYIERLDD